ncbi:MAG TPA: GNAT family N-acetyltransferase [Bacteroidales bacterium]|nr:GNAT family N-acetyltransferase [Bacteroidales bacterium]
MKEKIKILQQNNIEEFCELISVFENVFKMDPYTRPGETHLKKLLQNNHFYAIVTLVEKRIIAGLTLYVLDQYYSEKPLAYIYDLAVLPEYQRKGIGRRLVEFTNEYCMKNGFEEVFVQADKVDDYAIEFYRSTKPTDEEQVVHFYYKLPGNKQ